MKRVVVVSAVRTPVGKAPRGVLSTTRPDELAALVLREALLRAAGGNAELAAAIARDVEDVILGCAMPEAEQGLNVARIASLRAGIPVTASAVTVNRFCSSGLQAIAQAAERIMLGYGTVMLAGGTESMSMVPMGGNKVAPNPGLVNDYPDVYLTTGLVGENHARESRISREAQDAFSFRSHQRALAAIAAGKFKDEIVGVNAGLEEQAGLRTDTQDGQRTTTQDGLRTTTQDGLRTTTQDGLRTTTQDGLRTTTQDGQRTTTQDGQRTDTQDGQRTTTQDGLRTTTQDGLRTTTQDGLRTDTQDGQRTTTQDGQRTTDVGRPALQGRHTLITQDEGPRKDTSLEALAKLKPAFLVNGTVTAGNSSQMSDGAAAVVLMEEEHAKQLGLTPLGRFIAYTTAGVAPEMFGIGPVPAIRKLLAYTKLKLEDIDLFELNEAFAAQVLADMKELAIPDDKLNVNGGAVALGHPLGCTGARLTATLLHEMRRRGSRYGIVSMCVGGGMGAAGLFQAIQE